VRASLLAPEQAGTREYPRIPGRTIIATENNTMKIKTNVRGGRQFDEKITDEEVEEMI